MILGHESRSLLNELPEIATVSNLSRHLRKTLDPEQARLVSMQVELRQRARKSRGDNKLRWLTRVGLEQATAPQIARWRAHLLGNLASGDSLWDATSGLGSDALALADSGLDVLASDRDPETAWCASSNLRDAGHGGLVLVADAADDAVRAPFVLLDPDRRAAGARSQNPLAWSPDLATCLRLLARRKGGAIKLAPSFEIPAELDCQGAFSWVSLGRELKEVTWFHGTVDRDPLEREVIALDLSGGSLSYRARRIAATEAAPGDPGWLAEPDPGLIRSGLLAAFARDHGCRPLSPRLAWLGSDERPDSGLLRAHRVLAAAPVDRRQVRRMLAEFDIGPLEIWKRGHPDPAEVLAKRFAGSGSRRGILAIGRLESGHRAWLLDPAP